MNRFTPTQKKLMNILHAEGDRWAPYKQRDRHRPIPRERNGCLSLYGAVYKAVCNSTKPSVTAFHGINSWERVDLRSYLYGKVDGSDFACCRTSLVDLHERTSLSLHNIAQLMEAVPWMFFVNFKTPAYLVPWNGIYIHAQYGKPDLNISQVLDSCTPPQWRSRMDRAYKLRLESLSKVLPE